MESAIDLFATELPTEHYDFNDVAW